MSSIEINDAAPPSPLFTGRVAVDPIALRVTAGFVGYFALLTMSWLAFKRWTPDYLAVRLLGHAIRINDLHSHVFSHGFELAAIFPAIMVFELAWTGWADSSLRRLAERTPSSMSDLACYLMWETKVMSVFIVTMTLGVSLISGAWVHDKISALTGLSLSAAAWPLWLQVPALFLVFSFFDYWNHRVDHSHHFWPMHRFHHAADDFCVVTASRVHPALFTGVISAVGPAVVLGASPEAIFDLGLGSALLRYVIHSRIDSNFGFIGRWVVQSPNHHRLHHVRDISVQPVGHYSLAPIWDHLFGTWRGDADQNLVIGVDDAPYRQGAWVWPDLWRDYADFWRGVYRSLTGKPRLDHTPVSTPS